MTGGGGGDKMTRILEFKQSHDLFRGRGGTESPDHGIGRQFEEKVGVFIGKSPDKPVGGAENLALYDVAIRG